jgi:hypothetical protein
VARDWINWGKKRVQHVVLIEARRGPHAAGMVEGCWKLVVWDGDGMGIMGIPFPEDPCMEYLPRLGLF